MQFVAKLKLTTTFKNSMKTPDNFSYTKEHMWASKQGEVWLVGITDYAQDLLGDVVFIDPPKVGTVLVAHQPCGLIESVKTGSDLHAPLNGTVVEVNDEVLGSPELVNDKPYKSWLFKMSADSDVQTDTYLLDASAYEALISG
jgi:glycine cleavage system H protein